MRIYRGVIARRLHQISSAPAYFEQAPSVARAPTVKQSVSCRPDAKPYINPGYGTCDDAGLEEAYVAQIGPERDRVSVFWGSDIESQFAAAGEVMMATAETSSAARYLPEDRDLGSLQAAARRCRGCPPKSGSSSGGLPG